MSELSGSYTVAVTPFTDGIQRLDLEAWTRFLDWQIDVGVPGIIILGTTGEFLTITEDEREAFVASTVQHVAGRAKVVVGTMNAHTPTAVRYSRQAQELGADGLMILPPYYYTPTDEEIFRYYAAIGEAVEIPIMLYNNPVTSNVDMSAELVARLARALGNVRYIKESSQDIGRVREVIDATDGRVRVFAGEQLVNSYLLGAIGYVNPYGNYIPRSSCHIMDLLEQGRIDEARQLQRLIDRIDRIIAAGHPTYGHQCYSKALAAAAGYPVGDVRPPLTTIAQLGDEGQQRLAAIAPLMAELDSACDRLGLP